MKTRTFFLMFIFIMGFEPRIMSLNDSRWCPLAYARTPYFVEVKEMLIPVIQSREVQGFFSITFTLDCVDYESFKRTQKFLPIVRDRLFWDLYVLLGVVWSDNLYVDIERLKDRMLRTVHYLLGDNAVKTILIVDFHQHRRKNIALS